MPFRFNNGAHQLAGHVFAASQRAGRTAQLFEKINDDFDLLLAREIGDGFKLGRHFGQCPVIELFHDRLGGRVTEQFDNDSGALGRRYARRAGRWRGDTGNLTRRRAHVAYPLNKASVIFNQPSASTKNPSLNGSDTTVGGTIIMPTAINTDATTRSITINGKKITNPI